MTLLFKISVVTLFKIAINFYVTDGHSKKERKLKKKPQKNRYNFRAFKMFQVYQYFTIYRWYFLLNLNNFHEYLIQNSLKSGGAKDHFRRTKVPGTTPY